MPTYNFTCPKCKRKTTKLLKSFDVKVEHFCPLDSSILERNFDTGPSAVVKEVIDNGLYPRKVEQYTDTAELIKENESKKV